MVFCDAIDDFGIVVGGCVGLVLAGEGYDRSRVIVASRGQLVWLLPCSHFEACPLAPEVDAGGGLNYIGDVRAADAGGDFQEIEPSIGMRFQEFGVRDAPEKTQLIKDSAIDFEE